MKLGKKLAEEALTGKRFVRKIFDDGDERLQHDDWKTASEPPLKTEQPWTGTTSFEIRSEFIKTIGNMIQNNAGQEDPEENQEEGTFVSASRFRGKTEEEEASRSRGEAEGKTDTTTRNLNAGRFRGEAKQESKVVFHRFTQGSHDNLLELDRCKGLDAHFADSHAQRRRGQDQGHHRGHAGKSSRLILGHSRGSRQERDKEG